MLGFTSLHFYIFHTFVGIVFESQGILIARFPFHALTQG